MGLLPKLNIATYKDVVPSTSQEYTYSPYTVKDEKEILISDSKNQMAQMQAIINLLKKCIVEEIDFENLATFDIEYMFTRVRSKSTGNIITPKISCEKCNFSHDNITIDLDEVSVDFNEAVFEETKIVEINNELKLMMRYPTINLLKNNW